MSRDWIPIDLDTKWFTNVDETALTRAMAALENGYVTEANGLSRFPGLKLFADFGGEQPVYIEDFGAKDMIAVTGGRVFRLDESGAYDDVTDVPVTGGRRVVFAETDKSLLMAAGGSIVEFPGTRTRLLSDQAPPATHVAFIDNFAIAGEMDSDRWQYSAAGQYDQWDPLDSFAATGAPDNITAIMVTPFRELLFAGPKSIEQYERLPSGDPPFFRRWAVGEGNVAPYTMMFADNASWCINSLYELVRLSGQVSQSNSDAIGRTLKKIDNWDEAWASDMQVVGQKFILLVAPHATNTYGTKGVTLIYDYRQKKWSSLYGWDPVACQPAAWPGWSYKDLWGRSFVGARGKIYELTEDSRYIAGNISRFLMRTAHLSQLGEIRIDRMRIRVKRGTGTYTTAAKIGLRANRDNKSLSPWRHKSLGLAGQREMNIEFPGFGAAHTWQFEIEVTDDTPVEIVKLEAQLTRLGH